MSQAPSIGRIVHYHSYGTPGGEYLPEPRAAIITDIAPPIARPGGATVPNMRVGLAVLNPTGMFFNQSVPFAEDPTPGHWSWPPRAAPAVVVKVSDVVTAEDAAAIVQNAIDTMPMRLSR